MKNLTYLLIVLFAFSSAAFANGGDTKSSTKTDSVSMNQSTNRMFEQVMAYPTNIRSANAKEIVLLAFSVEPCGTVNVHESNSSNPEFLDYVLNKIENSEMRFDLNDEVQYLKCVFIKE